MDRKIPQSVGDVLRNLLQESELQGRMDELNAARLWPKIVGEYIAANTSKPSVSKGVMMVGVPNAALRNELYISRSVLMKNINHSLGKEIIKEIKFTS